ncbi:MAG: hypothetical protein QOI93_5588, partial [Rhodospirillaceae bacterium]|nr:hypothetical protein [Rhodospirillaceae bacterium]
VSRAAAMRNSARFTFMVRRGVEDHGRGRELGDLAHAAHEFVSVEPGHDNVTDHKVRTNLFQGVKRFFAVGGFDRLVATGSKDCRQELAVNWSILDDQNNGQALRGWRGARPRF